jgi:hypothetical protein
MISMQKNFIFLLVCGLFFSCNKGKFKTNNSDFQNIYNNLIKGKNKSEVTWDTEVHSYTFTLSENKKLKSIGYQSHEDLGSIDYVIEIIKDADSSIIYNGAHRFSTTKLSYVIPNTPITLTSGVSYTIRRIQTNWQQDIGRTIGHLVMTEPSDYPLQHGVLKITGTEFHDYQTPSNSPGNLALPRIDMVLE